MLYSQNNISNLSPHLFWDVDISHVNFNTSQKFIVERVLEFGLISDWRIIVSVYGMEEIKKTSLQLRTLDPVTLSFLSGLFNLSKQSFRCYKNKPSTQNYWTY